MSSHRRRVGIARIGEFGGDAHAIARLPEGADVTVELADYASPADLT